ncbi:MAG: DUF4034 domain-containing protein [Leptolyngbya sp. SIOISBB]|nr:DUF4034 domain-containing protein [Leptolyngbya sp. SIOISBB]
MSTHHSVAATVLLGTALLLPGCQLLNLSQLAAFDSAQATESLTLTQAPHLAGASADPELLNRYTFVPDIENWYPILYENRDFAQLETFIQQSLQREQSDELASAYLSRLYLDLGEPPAHADKTPSAADQQQFDYSMRVLDQWSAAYPDSHIPYLIRGRLLINQAWEYRSESLASRVSPEAWAPFRELLQQAQIELETAAELNPQDPNVWAALLVAARGLGQPEAVWQDDYDRGLAANPDHLELWGMKAMSLSPQWQDSEARLLAFGQEADRRSQSGNQPMLGLITLFIHREIDGDRPAHLQQPDVWGQVEAIYARIFAAYPDHLRMRYYYAYDAAMAKQWSVAAEQFEIIGDRWTSGTPWRSLEHFHTGRTAAFYEQATDAYEQQRYLQAEELALQAIDLMPVTGAYLILGVVQAAYYGNMPGVIEYAEQALANNPTPAEQQYAADLIRQAEAHLLPQ